MSRVLIVDDDRSQSQDFEVLLRNAGCDVMLAGNGREAMELLRRDLPDVVLTDLDMPEMDGLALVQTVRRDYPALPVILMTAMGSEAVAAKALHHGAASYVRKRSLAREVVRTVGSVLAIARALPQQTRVFDCLTDDQLDFVLDNDAGQIPAVLGHLELVASLLHPRDRTDGMRVGIALHEVLINAIEHGNLELNSDLREEDESLFRDLGEERRRQYPFRDRRVRLRAMLSRSEAVYVVEDDGPGFDPAALPDPTDPAKLERCSGRGMMLIRTFMDEVEHDEKGNRITLRKRHPITECSSPATTGACNVSGKSER
jgi:CheY-like chemotaxis protein